MWYTRHGVRSLLCVALLGVEVLGDIVDESLSFGQHENQLSPNLRGIPGWHIQGEPDPPRLLKDRIILTPPYPGNKRAAVFSEKSVSHQEWTAEVGFRATGPERGGGNMNIWYAKGGHQAVGTSSIYTVNQFDGLVLVIDTYGGRGGSIRAFLNDDTVDFKSHHNVDSLSFGHCDYPYRNLGRLTKLQLKQSSSGFEVNVDDKLCFKSDQVNLPPNYYFGISAASAEQPDSFEAYRFAVSSPTTTPPPPAYQPPPPAQAPPIFSNDQTQQQIQQISDLTSRLQSLTQQLDTLEKHIQDSIKGAQARHDDLSSTLRTSLSPLGDRIQSIESTLQTIQRDTEGANPRELRQFLERTLKDSHSNLMEHLPQSMDQIVSGSAPRMWFFIGIIALLQALLAVAYVVYKKRRANAPKKFL